MIYRHIVWIGSEWYDLCDGSLNGKHSAEALLCRLDLLGPGDEVVVVCGRDVVN